MAVCSSSRREALAPGVHVVPIDGDLVFLDVGQDRYVCLPGAARQAQLDAARTGLRIQEPQLVHDLRQAGLTAGADAARPPWRPPPTPTASAVSTTVEPVRWADVSECARAVADLLVAYRGRSLGELVVAARRRGAPAPEAKRTDDALAVVARFHRWAPFAPTSAKCLLRSFMLLRLLQRQGHDALWVFGVRTGPFEAHCWLQIEDTVLDEDLDRVAAHQPILVV